MQVPTITPPPVDLEVILLPTIVMGLAMVLLLIDLFLPRPRVIGLLALLGVIATAVIGVVVQSGMTRSAFSEMVVQDPYSLYLNLILLGGTALTILLALDYMPNQGMDRGEFYPLLLFATGGMMLLVQSQDLIMLFISLELLSITLYVLTGFAYPRLSSGEAAMKYLLLGAFAAGFLVYGIALIYGVTGQTSFGAIAQALTSPGVASDPLLLVGLGLLLVALGFKVAVVPFHTWTPDVYEGAPTPVTAYMSVATKAAAFAALFRLLLVAFPALMEQWATVLATLSVLTMIVGNVVAVAQSSIKRMLAYSSIAHAGYIMLGVLASNPRGSNAMLLYLLAYTLTNIGAFGVVAALEMRRKSEEPLTLRDLGGLGARQPLLAVAMSIFMLSLAGVPPTAGFIGKFAIFQSAWDRGFEALALIGVITSVVSAFFYLRVIVMMYMSESTGEERATFGRPLAVGLAVAAVMTLLLLFLLGVLPDAGQPAIIAAR